MAERPSNETPFERLDPAQVSSQSFALTRKGFDQKQVQAYLVSVSNQIQGGQQQIRDLRELVAQTDTQSEPEASFSLQGVKLLDNDVEASRRQGQTEAGDMATRARLLAEELQTTVEGLRSHQQVSGVDQVAELLEQAYEQAQAVAGMLQEARDQAEAEVEHGREKGREIVEQAKSSGLTGCGHGPSSPVGPAQVERCARPRQANGYLSDIRSSIDHSLDSAKLSLTEAKVMADAAARRVEDEAEPTDLALLSELDDAQTVGMVPDLAAAPEAQVQPEPVAPIDVESSLDEQEAQEIQEIQEIQETQEDQEVNEGVTMLASVEPDPVETAADHPALASADDGHDVDAIFARLRSQSDKQQKDAKAAAKATAAKD